MKEFEVVFIEKASGNDISGKVTVTEDDTDGKISIKAVVNGSEYLSSGYAYLQVYQDFRDKILDDGFGIKCNGSRINAVQPEMMGDTDKIILLEMGKNASMKDAAHIWDPADIDEFPDTKQQNDFFVKWASR